MLQPAGHVLRGQMSRTSRMLSLRAKSESCDGTILLPTPPHSNVHGITYAFVAQLRQKALAEGIGSACVSGARHARELV